MTAKPSRRKILKNTGALAAAAIGYLPVPAPAQTMRVASPGEPFGFCLNTSTITGANLSLVEELEIAAKAGFRAVEPWIRDIEAHVKKGGTLADLAKRASDLGITLVNGIGFDEWIVDDDDRRAKGMEALKGHMDILAQIGCKMVAAPAIGAQKTTDPLIDLEKVAERYRAVLDLGDKMGVVPIIEMWGASKNLHTLAELTHASIAASHPKASMLLDVYHLHRGGSGYAGLSQVNGASLHVLHMNDFPDMPLAKLTDAHRVYPGDGVAPLDDIFRTLLASGFRGYLSLELFNRDYWKQNPLKVAETGMKKMKDAVKKALG